MSIPINTNLTYTAHPHTDGYLESDHDVTWVFSDGSTATGLSVVKKWTEPGFYTATARAVNKITKRWALATNNCNAEYIYPGDITIDTNVPLDTSAGTEVVFGAIAHREIEPRNGYTYYWTVTSTMDGTRGGPSQYYTCIFGHAQLVNWTVTATDNDNGDFATASGSLTVQSDSKWGYQYTDEDNISNIYPSIVLGTDNNLYCTSYGTYSDPPWIMRYDPFHEGVEKLFQETGGTSPTGYLFNIDKGSLTSLSNGKLIYFHSSGHNLYYNIYNPATNTQEKINTYAATFPLYWWPRVTYRYEIGGTLYFGINVQSGQYANQINYSEVYPLYGKTFHCGYDIDSDEVFSIPNFETATSGLFIRTGIGGRYITHIPDKTYANRAELECDRFITRDTQSGNFLTGDTFFLRPFLNTILGSSQWYATNIIPIPNDNNGRFIVSYYDNNTATVSTNTRVLLIDPSTDDDYGFCTEITNNVTYTGCTKYDLMGQKWTIVGENVVGLRSDQSNFPVPQTGNNIKLTGAIFNLPSVEIVTFEDIWYTAFFWSNVVYHPIFDRLFSIGREGAVMSFSKPHFSRFGYYFGDPGTLPLTAPDITGADGVSTTPSLYKCISNYNMAPTYAPGLRCEWSISSGGILSDPTVSDVTFNAPEFHVRVSREEGNIDDLTLTARIYTTGGEVIKTKTLTNYDPMAYYNPITPIAYGETKSVTIPSTSQVNPKDPIRMNMCSFLEFNGSNGDLIEVRVIAQSYNWDTYVIVYNSALQVLWSDDDGAGNANSLISNRYLPATGKYYISVMGYGDSADARVANVILTKFN